MTAVSEAVTDLVEQVWLDTKQVAIRTGRHPVTVRKAAASGRLRSVQAGSGRGRRYRPEWADQWVEER